MTDPEQVEALKSGLVRSFATVLLRKKVCPSNLHFLRLFDSSELSDLKIKCGWYEFVAHKAVLCAQSEYSRAISKKGKSKVSDCLFDTPRKQG